MQSSYEATTKKKLQKFLWELANFGTVRGFKHFSCYLRGKEELLVTVKNKIQGSTASIISGTLPISPAKKPLSATDSFNSFNLPYDKSSIVFSLQNQTLLQGREDKEADLLPASPSEEETQTEADVTLFLIAGYARYACPYVWVRSNHQRIFKVCGDKDSDKDSPLKLKSTSRWRDEDVKIFDIVAEIVKLCTYPAPRNPFELDLDYFRFLKQPDQLLASAAMTCLLQTVIIHSPESKVYTAKVFEELQLVSRIHFKSLRDLTQDGKLEVLPKGAQELRNKAQQQSFKPSPAPVASSVTIFKQPMPKTDFPKNRNNTAYHDGSSKTPLCQASITAPTPPVPSHTQAVLFTPTTLPYPRGNSSLQYYTPNSHAPLRTQTPAAPYSWPQNQQGQKMTPPPGPGMMPPAGPVSLMTPSALPGTHSSHASSVHPPDPFSIQNSVPSNVSGITYGRGARGAYPGGYDRMPAPSML